jgi:hypothetical protein
MKILNIDSENFCKIGFTFYNSFHLAFAEAAEVKFFLTTDDGLLRKVSSHISDVQISGANPVNSLMENQELIQVFYKSKPVRFRGEPTKD